MNERRAEITVLENGGPLTKHKSLAPDGTIKDDNSACRMVRGVAWRQPIVDVGELAAIIEQSRFNQAFAPGTLRVGLPDKVQVVTKRNLNGQPDTIARTRADINYRSNKPAPMLLDFDTKGMPPEIVEEIKRRGGFWQTLVSIVPHLGSVAHLIRRSTSAGLYRTDTGQKLPGSGGLHVYLWAQDGADIERALRVLHDRCWNEGFGWMMLGRGGQLLERSIVDRMVGAPEHLMFEADPILGPLLGQDRESRRPIAADGASLNTLATFPPPTLVEKAMLCALKAKDAHRLAPEATKARAAFVADQAERLAQRSGISVQAAAEQITRQCDGVLLPDIILPFDDEELAGCTVGHVLADPLRFEGATLADPLEGIEYGPCKARIMRRGDGTPWINSFAHGHTVYELKYNAATVRSAMAAANNSDIVKTFVKLAMAAELSAVELEELRNETSKRSHIGKQSISRMLRAAQQEQADKRREEERKRRLAERSDPRPMLEVPVEDAPWLPQMDALNAVIGDPTAAHPTLREIEGDAAFTADIVVPETHVFTAASANSEEENTTSLPTPKQWIIKRMSLEECAELIERHIDFVNRDGRSVHLPASFVRHYLKRKDGALPTVVAVSTLPLVFADGGVWSDDKFDRLRGIDFRIQPEVAACVSKPGSVTGDAVYEAMTLLSDKWLIDVATDYAGKCTIIAAALTLIERTLLDQRPAFWVTAGRRGGGKTTTLTMMIKAVTGIWPAAAAWSTNEEERRKALLAYFLYGVPYILWDNIARGTQISCPHIEKSCTAAFYADRKLGVSEMVATAASTIHFFTGNNIAPRGDLASRSLQIRLELDRYDPENREFEHPDPIGWTDSKRAEILRALYTILLGNPTLKQPRNAPMRTRFKKWWRLVGSAVEHAAELAAARVEPGAYDPGDRARPCVIDFQRLFLARDDEDEDATSLAEALAIMADRCTMVFDAAEVARLVNDQGSQHGTALREFLYPGSPLNLLTTPRSVGKQLSKHLDEPIKHGERTLILRKKDDQHAKQGTYFVERLDR